jgi:DHA2 family methylenomycin A resistance protein-like MFS transporter
VAKTSERTVLIVMCVGYFLVLLDVTIVNVALPQIAAGTGASVSTLQWVVDGYTLALASLMLAGGTVGDLYGHRRVVLAGLAVFGLGSLGCGAAAGAGVLVGARAVQGIGAALLLPGTLAIVSDTFAGEGERARAIGVWAGVGSLALPAGPLVGGLLIGAFGWRAVFLLNVPIVLAALPAVRAIVPEQVERRDDRRLDRAGVVLGALLLLALTFAPIEAGREGIGSVPVLGAIGAGAALLIAFLAVERRLGEEAMLPLGLFRRPAFSAANAVAAAMNLGTLGTLFVLTLFLQSLQHRSPLAAGLALVPLFAPLALLAPLGGQVVAKVGSRLPIATALLVAALGLALLGEAESGSSYASLLPAFLLWGIGLGILTPAVVAAAIGAAPGDRSGLASAINNTSRQAGGAIGIALAGAIAAQPGGGDFLGGFHAVAIGAAGLYVLAALFGLVFVPGRVSLAKPHRRGPASGPARGAAAPARRSARSASGS